MRASFNFPLIRQFDLDSGALTQLCNVVHRFDKAGSYRGSVLLGEESAATFVLNVSDKAAHRPTYIDLYRLHHHGYSLHRQKRVVLAGRPVFAFNLRTGNYALFHLSLGDGGYSVVVEEMSSVEGASEEILRGGSDDLSRFDSRRLGDGDFLAVTPLRPGTYEISNRLDGATGRLRVLYPNPREQRDPTDRTLEPARIDCQPGSFNPDSAEVLPAQGLVFQLHTAARITITLQQPDDGPEESR